MGKKNKSSPLVEAPRQGIERLQDLYCFRPKEEVTEFLESHSYLVTLLLEAHPQIEKHFAGHPVVFLEVVADPDATDDRELFALIGTRLDTKEALEKLHQFDRSWWLNALDRARGELCIHVEFL